MRSKPVLWWSLGSAVGSSAAWLLPVGISLMQLPLSSGVSDILVGVALILTVIALVLLVVGTCYRIDEWWRQRAQSVHSETAPPGSTLRDAPALTVETQTPPGTSSTTFELREARGEYQAFEASIKQSQEVWVFWYTGDVARVYDIFGTKKIARVLLVSPRNEEVPALAAFINKSPSDFGESIIRETAKKARDAGAEVKLWNGHIGDPFVVGNPQDTRETWVSLDYVVPFLKGPHERPQLQTTQAFHGPLCDKVRQGFQDMWHNEELTENPPDAWFQGA